ncbi:ABC transporter substrate-binding protein [Oceanobacillus rekensis]|uniref:ABC transporter substrate-binding protein n=1 Tax=Oceanobacillus rekensis TaxID=937927 RepID=UPI0015949FBE|nr:ABC transporter substrate-binding protein [Oceanobacillus rekensis]
MVKFKKITFVNLVLLLVLTVIVGCSSESGSSEESQAENTTDTNDGTPKQGGEATVTFLADVSSYDPILSTTGTDQSLLWPVYETLIGFTPELELKPGLAESWETPDDTTIILHLREGVTFHDGTPLDADAVKFNLDRVNSDDSLLTTLVNVENVEVVDTYTVKLQLSEPDASILSALSDREGMIVSPTAIEENGEDYAQNPVGAGPYKMVERVPNGEIVFEAFEDYWQEGKPYLDKLTVKIMADENTRINALKSGEADLAYHLSVASSQSFKNDPNFVLTDIMPLRHRQIFLNASMAPIDNKDVRLAILHAIDRDALIEAITFGEGEPANQSFPKDYWAANENMKIEYNPEKSRKLLEEAGVEDVSFTMITHSIPTVLRVADAVQSQLSDVGIEVNIEPMEIVAADGSYFADKEAPAYLTAYTGRADPHQAVKILYASDSYYNVGSHSTPEIESLISEAVSIYNQGERAKLYSELSKKAILEEAIVIPIIFEPHLSVNSSRLKGYEPNLIGKAFFNDIWIEE